MGGIELIVTELELTAVPLTVDATPKEKFDVGSVTVRPILIVSPAAMLQVLSSVMTSAPVATEPPPDWNWKQSSTSETLLNLVVATTALLTLSVTVIESPLGMAMGAVMVIT
jgi:uncharacterized membrane protein YkvI